MQRFLLVAAALLAAASALRSVTEQCVPHRAVPSKNGTTTATSNLETDASPLLAPART
tara:strand:+ start:233 stop:406 length:174 start_codon:yes stop_codon:yes gene_type:complete